jgi:ABC-type Zn uptake system ZnuABC Zn-binding protein ZnuA
MPMFSLLGVCVIAFSANAQPKVEVTLPVLYSLAAMVMGNETPPHLLLNPSQDAHHFHLRPSQMDALAKADTVVYYDEQFEAFIPKLQAAERAGKAQFIALSAALPPSATVSRSHGWLAPEHAIRMLDYLANTLAKQDPKQATHYHENARHAQEKIKAAAEKWHQQLKGLGDSPKKILVDHDAFPAFTQAFALAPVLPLEYAGGDINLSRLKAADAESVSCVIATHGKSAMMERLAEAKQARLITHLNPLGSYYPATDSLYFLLMDEMVKEFQRCLTQT